MMGEALQRRICLPVSSIIMNHLPSYHSNEYPILLNLMFYFILIGPPKNGWNLLAWNKKNKTSTWTPTNPNLKKDGSAASPKPPRLWYGRLRKNREAKKKNNNNNGRALPDKRFRPERSKALMTWLASGILQDHDRWFDVMCMFVF